jgi:hypothetical protein
MQRQVPPMPVIIGEREIGAAEQSEAALKIRCRPALPHPVIQANS